MRPCSAMFLAAVRDGGRRVHRVYVRPAGGAFVEVNAVGYSVTADRSSVARYSGQVELEPGTDLALVEPYGAEVRVRSGFLLGATEELVDVGTMRIDEVGTTATGTVALSCFGFEKAVEDATFRTPRIVSGVSIVGAIIDLLTITGRTVSVTTARDAQVTQAVYDTDRWKAVDGDDKSLARSLGLEVYADAAGTFVVRDTPTLADAAVWSVNAGPSGVLVDYRAQLSREGVYSVVVAASDQAGDTQVLAIAQDGDPNSKTYVAGPFGEVVRQYRSPLLTSIPQAQLAADSILANSRGLALTLSMSAVPNPALEPGDVVTVILPNGALQSHLIDRIGHASAGEQSADTRTTEAAGAILEAFQE